MSENQPFLATLSFYVSEIAGQLIVTTRATGATARIDAGGSAFAHPLLDGAIDNDTTAGTVARGDVITGQGASATWTRKAKGTANQLLGMDGTATDVAWITNPTVGALTATSVTNSALSTNNAVVKANGSGLLASSSLIDNGTTVSTTEALSVAALTATGIFTQGSAGQNTISAAGLQTKSNAVTLVGMGYPLLVGAIFEKAESGTDANVLTYTPGATDEHLIIDVALDVNAITPGVGSLKPQLAYTDGNNTSVSATNIPMEKLGGTTPLVGITATGNYYQTLSINAHTAANVVVSISQNVTSYTAVITVTVKRQQ